MPFDSTGLTPKTQEEILLELNAEVVQNVRNTTGDNTLIIDTSTDKPIGRLNSVVAKHLADIWTQAKLVEETMRVDKTVGVSLEKLAMLVGFTRKPASSTRGDLRLIGENDTLVSSGSVFSSLQEDNFTNPEDIIISLSDCYSANIKVGILIPSREYTISIDSDVYTFTSDVDPTIEEVLQGLETLINLDNKVTATYNPDVEFPDESYLRLVKDDQSLTMDVVLGSVLISDSVEVEGLVVSSQRGIIFGDANTIVNIITSQSGLDSVYNPADFIIGTIAETDSELSARVSSDYNTVGSGTKDTIEAVIDRDPNVRSVLVEENRLFVTNPNNIPPKSYEVIINHEGTSEEMAQLVWNTKPAGIATYGDIQETVMDSRGEEQTVEFSLATDLFVYVKVEATELDPTEGENLPANYEDLIQDAITLEGNSYNINQDVIAKRFYGIIYNTVEGIDELDVQVYLDTDPNLDPLTIGAGLWQDTWPVDRKEISSFATDRFNITVTPF